MRVSAAGGEMEGITFHATADSFSEAMHQVEERGLVLHGSAKHGDRRGCPSVQDAQGLVGHRQY